MGYCCHNYTNQTISCSTELHNACTKLPVHALSSDDAKVSSLSVSEASVDCEGHADQTKPVVFEWTSYFCSIWRFIVF